MARIRELTNAIAELRGDEDGAWRVLREALETAVRLVGPMMPHLAEELWRALGHDTLLVDQPWPEADPAMLVEDNVTIAVQVNGKLRGTLDVPKGADADFVAPAGAGPAGGGRAAGRPGTAQVRLCHRPHRQCRGAGRQMKRNPIVGGRAGPVAFGRIAATLALLLVLAGCGFRPMYGTRSTDPQVAAELSNIYVQPIADREGQLVHNAILVRLNPNGGQHKPRYRLQVVIGVVEAQTILATDQTATRADVTSPPTYELFEGDTLLTQGTSCAISPTLSQRAILEHLGAGRCRPPRRRRDRRRESRIAWPPISSAPSRRAPRRRNRQPAPVTGQ